jgi:type I restriction enzyme S subunit
MAEYKDFKEPEGLPEGWKKVRLGEILKFLKGKTPRKLYDYEEEGMTIYLTPEYLRKNKCDVAFCKKEETLLANEDIIILWDGSNAGEVFWAEKGAVASTMAKIDINSSDYPIYKKFLYYYLKSNEFAFKYQVKGSGIPHFEKDILNTLNSIFPPLPEQRKIAEILETVDNAIEKTEKIIEKYKRIKQGLMQDLLTKGIDENGNIRSEKTHKFKDSPLGRIPEEWEVVRLGEVGEIIVKKMLLPLPPLPEQQRIAEILSQIDQAIEKEEQYKEKLEHLKQGLMQDLLTGKVRVNHLIEEGAENVST